MIFRSIPLIMVCAVLLACPWSFDCLDDVDFSTYNIPSTFDSIKVEVYNLQDSLVLSQTGTLDFSDKYMLGYYHYGYSLNYTTNIKMSIHCANGWQSFPFVKAKLPSENCGRVISFSYDGSEKRSDSKRIPAIPIENVCEIPGSAVFIVSEMRCY